MLAPGGETAPLCRGTRSLLGESAEVGGAVFLCVCLTIGTFALAGGLATPAGDDPHRADLAARAVVEDATHRFTVVAPDGWTVRTSPPSEFSLGPPTGNSNIAIRSEPWCSEGTLPQAEGMLTTVLGTYATYSGFSVFEAIQARMLNGHASAHAVITHFLAYGRAYQVLAVVLGPEWSTNWVFSGLVHDVSEIDRWSEINATWDSFTVRPGPMPGTLSHNGTHFSVSVPPGWEATPDVASGGGTADAVLVDSLTGTSVVIVSEGRSLQGTTAEARAILQEAIDGLATRTGFAILEPVHDRVVDGHPAAEVYLTWQPSTYNLNADIIVVVGAEWQQFWALSGSSYSWFGPGSRTCLNWTAQRFDIADVPFATAIPMFLERYSLWILVTGLVATTVEGSVLGYLVARSSRRSH